MPLGGLGSDARCASPFASFWMVGFAGADHIGLPGQPIDMVAITGHAALQDAARADSSVATYTLGSARTRRAEPSPAQSLVCTHCPSMKMHCVVVVPVPGLQARSTGRSAGWWSSCHWGR